MSARWSVNDGKAESGSRRGADDFRVERTNGAFPKHHAGASEGFGRAENRAQVAGILQSSEYHDGAYLHPLQHIVERKFFEAHQRGHALRRFAGHETVEQLVTKQ